MLTERRSKKIKSVAARRQADVLILEDIYDPHNAAAVWRSCDAFGIQKVCLIFEKQKKFNPKKIGKVTSASANKWLDFEVFDSAKKCLKVLKKRGYTVVATVLDQKAKPIIKTNFAHKKLALMLGNESRGLSQAAIELADEHVYIPMLGFVQSLNLSVTAALCMYELGRQRQGRQTAKFLLPPKERNKLIKLWGKK